MESYSRKRRKCWHVKIASNCHPSSWILHQCSAIHACLSRVGSKTTFALFWSELGFLDKTVVVDAERHQDLILKAPRLHSYLCGHLKSQDWWLSLGNVLHPQRSSAFERPAISVCTPVYHTHLHESHQSTNINTLTIFYHVKSSWDIETELPESGKLQKANAPLKKGFVVEFAVQFNQKSKHDLRVQSCSDRQWGCVYIVVVALELLRSQLKWTARGWQSSG